MTINQLKEEIQVLTVQIDGDRRDLRKELTAIDKMVEEGQGYLRAPLTAEAVKNMVKQKVAALMEKKDRTISSAAAAEEVARGLIDGKSDEISRLEHVGGSEVFQIGEDELAPPFTAFLGKVSIGSHTPENPACANDFVQILMETIPHAIVPTRALSAPREEVIIKKRVLCGNHNATADQVTEALQKKADRTNKEAFQVAMEILKSLGCY